MQEQPEELEDDRQDACSGQNETRVQTPLTCASETLKCDTPNSKNPTKRSTYAEAVCINPIIGIKNDTLFYDEADISMDSQQQSISAKGELLPDVKYEEQDTNIRLETIFLGSSHIN